MTVAELIAALFEFPANSEVRLACQPDHPVKCRIAGVTADEEALNSGEDAPVYLLEGDLIGYLPREVWDWPRV